MLKKHKVEGLFFNRADQFAKRIRRKTSVSSSVLALAILMPTPSEAFAQSAGATESAQSNSGVPKVGASAAADVDQASDIIVTGTSIRGVPPVGSDLIQLGRAEIETSTSRDVAGVIREVPQVLNFGVTDASRRQSGGSGNVTGQNSINIRGLGPYATLTLINGRRPVGQGTFGASVDPNTIPAIALERLEIIADGSSAVYGSDAVAGVANLIIRRRYSGIGIDTSYGFGDNFRNFVASAIVGADWGSGRFTLSGQHAYRSALNGFDRSYVSGDLTASGGTDFRVRQCNPGNVVVNGTAYGIPAGGATPAGLAANAGQPNRCYNGLAADFVPQQEINSGVLTADQDIGDHVKFFADGFYSRRDGLRRGPVAVQDLVVPETNAFFVAPAGVTLPACPASAGVPVGTRCETVQYSFAGDYGPAATDKIRSIFWQGTGGFDIDLGHSWNVSTYGSYGRSLDRVVSAGGNVNAASLAAALRSNNASSAFNPFGTSANNQAVIDAVMDNRTIYIGKSRQTDAGLRLDGPLAALPGGDVKIALGGQYNKVSLSTGRLLGRGGEEAGSLDSYGRTVYSLFGELFVPIFGEGNAVPGIQKLNVSIAGRYDHYSDAGKTTNPKIGVNWTPVNDLTIHGSYGTSFRAPLVSNYLSPTSAFNALYVQPFFDPRVNSTVNGVVYFGANPDLKPETARTYSLGIDYTPSSLPGAQFKVNYFNVNYDGQIALYFGNPNVLRQEAQLSSIILRGAAAQARTAGLIASGLPVFGSPADAAAATVFIDGRSINLGSTKARGIDFTFTVPLRTETAGNFRFALNGTRFFSYKVQFTPAGLLSDRLNAIDNPLKLRLRGTLGWDDGPIRATLFGNYQNAYNNTFSTLAPKVKSYATFDLSLGYKLDRLLGNESEIGLNVTNLFDKDPPFVDIAGGFDPVNASAIGRQIALTVRTRF